MHDKLDKTMNLNGFSAHFLHEIFRRMVLIREFELRAIKEREQGLIPGFIHTCIGQEATATGACMALEKNDVMTSTHRGHGHLLAKGGDPAQLLAELAGRTTGYCGGRGGSLHLTAFEIGSLGANGIVAGGLPIATGAALAFQMRQESRVALAFLGDGATNQGAFHEALNMAGLWKLPVIFLCENNGYAQSTPQHNHTGLTELSKRAESYNMHGVTIDGNDVIAVYNAVSEALIRARQHEGATLIEALTYRWQGHYEGDPQVYRPSSELEQWQQRDPITLMGAALMKHNLIDEESIVEIQAEVLEQLDAAVDFVHNSPHPAPKDAMASVYADIHDGKVF